MSDSSVLVLYSDLFEDMLDFLTEMGMVFVEEKHGDGPVHYACEIGGKVLELYPSQDGTTRAKFL